MGRRGSTPAGESNGHGLQPVSNYFMAIAGETIGAQDICVANGKSANRLRLIKADPTNPLHATLPMFKAATASVQGDIFIAEPFGVIDDFDTSALAVFDPIYLGAAGQLSSTPIGVARRVGHVLVVGGVGTGLVFFNGCCVSGGSHIKSGTAVIPNGTATVTVNSGTLGALLGGKKVFASLVEAEAAEGISSVVWSGNDLIINTIGNVAADRDVNYYIEVQP